MDDWTGIPEVEVPSLHRLTLADARQLARTAGLRLVVDRSAPDLQAAEPDADLDNWFVHGQLPSPDALSFHREVTVEIRPEPPRPRRRGGGRGNGDDAGDRSPRPGGGQPPELRAHISAKTEHVHDLHSPSHPPAGGSTTR